MRTERFEEFFAYLQIPFHSGTIHHSAGRLALSFLLVMHIMSVYCPLVRAGSQMLLRAMCLLWAMVTIPLSVVLFWSCVTIEGHVLSIAALALGIGPFL